MLGVVISILIYGGTQTGDLVIGVINMDDGVISGDFINAVEESGNNNIIIISEDEMNDVLLDGKASVVVSIPKGFSDSIISGNPVNVELISVKGEEVTAWLENFTNLYIKNIVDIASASNNDRERFMRTYEKFSESELKLSVESRRQNVEQEYIASEPWIPYIVHYAGNLNYIRTCPERKRKQDIPQDMLRAGRFKSLYRQQRDRKHAPYHSSNCPHRVCRTESFQD